MFVGRENFLSQLEELHASGRFELVVVYGRRRVGKTELLKEFCRGKEPIFFTAQRIGEKATLEALSEAVSEKAGFKVGISRFSDFLDFLAAFSKERRLVCVIDEFPDLARSVPSALGSLQTWADHRFPETKLCLVLCGSSVSFMEGQVLGSKSPLYGRRTAQIHVLPFTPKESRAFLGRSPEQCVVVQALTGGIPLYESYFCNSKSLERNIKELFLDSNGLLFTEPANLLNMEVERPLSYNTVLDAMGRGANRVVEIAGRCGYTTSNTSQILRTLESIGLVEKELPFGERRPSKGLWRICDGLFSFWQTMIGPLAPVIMAGRSEGAARRVARDLPAFVGREFERLCLRHTIVSSDLLVSEIARWWGYDQGTRSIQEIDICGRDCDGRWLFGECEWTTRKASLGTLSLLKYRSSLVAPPGAEVAEWRLYSRSGFADDLVSEALKDPAVRLLTPADLCGAGGA